jgi:hypothetical protein
MSTLSHGQSTLIAQERMLKMTPHSYFVLNQKENPFVHPTNHLKPNAWDIMAVPSSLNLQEWK